MARKKYYIGSRGPFFYEDTSQFQDGTFHQIYSEGPIRAGAPISGSDVLRLDDIGGAGGIASSAEEYITMSNTSGLTKERKLTQGAGIRITDGGENSTVTIKADPYFQSAVIDITSTPPV